MTERFATSPFGGGRFGIADFRRQDEMNHRRRAAKADGNDAGRADKWQLIRALAEARAVFGLSDRTIAVLEALLSFHQARELDGSVPIVVFPSNAELSLRSRGMADATLRRHLAALVQAGLIQRRDSPNGKRYCRRDSRGRIENAFGFDMAPLALRAAEIRAAADAVREEARACQKLRTEISIHLRDATRLIEAALSERRAGDWEAFAGALMPLGRRLPRHADRKLIEERLDQLVAWRARVETAYLDALDEPEMSGNDANSERHYQSSKTDSLYEYGSNKALNPTEAFSGNDRARDTERDRRIENPVIRPPQAKPEPVPLGYVLSVCPSLADYARNGLHGWADVVTTTELVRAMLGVTSEAWKRAREAMGDLAAAVTIAAILERGQAIRSPGGYLRALTKRAERGQFSVRPMLAALESGAGSKGG